MLDLQLQALMEQAAEDGVPDVADLSPEEARAFYREFAGATDAPVADVEIEDRRIPGPEGEIPVRVYRPREAGLRPLLLFYHGGGWVIGGLDEYHGVVSNLAAQSGCVTVSVDYRLAPEHRFPAAVEDSYAALEWAAAHAGELGADPARIALAGDSAGGNLTAVMALLARDRNGPTLSFQAMIYPATAAGSSQYDSYRKYGEGYILTARGMDYFWKHYMGEGAEITDYRAAPLLAEDLGGLPAALVMVAGFDPLHDEGLEYAQRLTEAGTHVMVTDYPTLSHGFITMSGVLDAGKLAVEQVAAAIRRAVQ
ncbi:MAG TPA: alpha/beta hydrolase [Gammaproteobacteria bacterium]|nr:alpha/beta hydrolase [Gammaproteobacteria bacterium]